MSAPKTFVRIRWNPTQIVPGTGWLGCYRDDTEPHGIWFNPVAVFALAMAHEETISGSLTIIGDAETPEIIGYCPMDSPPLEPCEASRNFLGYVHESQRELAVSWWGEEKPS